VLLVRPDRKDESRRFGNLAGTRQWIESVNETLKGQLDLEPHGGSTPAAEPLAAAHGPTYSNCSSNRWRTTELDVADIDRLVTDAPAIYCERNQFSPGL
jgi:hypothetical protein